MAATSTIAQPQVKLRGRGYWLSAWWPVALAVAVIVAESQTFMGADHTSGPLRAVWEFLFGRISDASWEPIHHLLRKSGHFLGYGAMGLTWLRAWRMTLLRSSFPARVVLAVLGTAVVASADEFHQSFLPNRTGTPSDVVLDCAGAIVLIVLSFAVARIRSAARRATAA